MRPQVQGNISSSNESSKEERNEEVVPEPMDHHEGESSSTKGRLNQLTNGVDTFWHDHHEFKGVSINNLRSSKLKMQQFHSS